MFRDYLSVDASPHLYAIGQSNAGRYVYAKNGRITLLGVEGKLRVANMLWPEGIESSIKAIEDAPFLTAIQKRTVLHDNSARFLRLAKDQ